MNRPASVARHVETLPAYRPRLFRLGPKTLKALIAMVPITWTHHAAARPPVGCFIFFCQQKLLCSQPLSVSPLGLLLLHGAATCSEKAKITLSLCSCKMS